MSIILNYQWIKSLVNYQKINDIVLGFLCLKYSAFKLLKSQNFEVVSSHYYIFLLVASFLSIFKGILLFYSVKRENKNGILIYLVLSTLILLTGTGLVTQMGIAQKKYVEEFEIIAGESYFTHVWLFYFLYYAVYFPTVLIILYFIQFYVFLFYRHLSRKELEKNEVRISLRVIESVPEEPQE